MLERDIEKAVCEYAKNKGFLVYKFTSPNRMAVPDRLLISSKGTVIFVEFKATDKTPTMQQEREHVRLRDQNAAVFVVNDIPAGKHIIDWYSVR